MRPRPPFCAEQMRETVAGWGAVEWSGVRCPGPRQWCPALIGPTVAYSHSGHLGQFMMVVPGSRLVAVRMIAHDHPQARAPESGFGDFQERVLALSRS